MNYSKLDAALGEALAAAPDREERFLVFLRINPDAGAVDADLLRSLGVNHQKAQRTVTATLAASDIERLSERPWVKSLKLSQRLKKL